MAWDRFAEILDLERAFEAGGEEAAKGGDERGEGGEDEDVELDGGDGEGEGGLVEEEWGLDGVGLGGEDGVGGALEAGEDVCAEVLADRLAVWNTALEEDVDRSLHLRGR